MVAGTRNANDLGQLHVCSQHGPTLPHQVRSGLVPQTPYTAVDLDLLPSNAPGAQPLHKQEQRPAMLPTMAPRTPLKVEVLPMQDAHFGRLQAICYEGICSRSLFGQPLLVGLGF